MSKTDTKRGQIISPVKRADIQEVADNGISVILCTKRPQFLASIFSDYDRQLYKSKELILVLNNNQMELNRYKSFAAQHPNVSVYQLDESVSLGRCLNFAVSKAKYSVIAKFDDDDYYSPYYLDGVARCFNKNTADVLGKNTCYLYLESRNLLLLYHPNRENRYTRMVMGATLAFRRKVFYKVKFRNVSRGEDTYFFRDCAKNKLKIYTCDPFNYVCIRRSNRFSHTWTVDEKTIMKHSTRVATTENFKPYITSIVKGSS
ncbi:glycosyltransferase [Alicyclobacillus fastidiosus]|uniref:Glycosyltransferase n=1 Tax=Alicyclobacillus fastidiosus TaxID=392011 RepID=A0ABY6ZGN5_9BACL|nr:glycosyltransferase [Alicyclobacillus fastidiosus]WAH41279.1 glycosyltransferase [Alicyclobacillus fastidiosus]GMA62876.1 glycosyl transferase [Alicyclobacillus fastidiosus]